MTFAWAILILFLLGYATFSGAVLWHLDTYAFSRSGRNVAVFFTIIALFLGILSIIFFAQIDWQNIVAVVEVIPKSI